MSRTRVRACFAGCIAPFVLGCPSLPEVAWEGEYVTFSADHPEQLCRGTRNYLDRRAGRLFEDLGWGPTRIEYYWLDNVADHCPENTAIIGCGRAGEVFSEWVPHLHEIVHARDSDRLPSALEEGFAFHFGDTNPGYQMASRERLTELMMGDLKGISGPEEYSRAAHFLAFISEVHGREQLIALDEVLSRDSSAQDVDVAFRALFGTDREGLLAAYEDYPECAGNVDMQIACDATTVAWLDPRQPLFQRRIDCAATDVMGPIAGLAFTEDIIEIGPAADGRRFVHTTGDGVAKGGRVRLYRCGPCSENGVVTDINDDPSTIPEDQLPAGRYVVQFYVPIDAGPVDIGVSIGGFPG